MPNKLMPMPGGDANSGCNLQTSKLAVLYCLNGVMQLGIVGPQQKSGSFWARACHVVLRNQGFCSMLLAWQHRPLLCSAAN